MFESQHWYSRDGAPAHYQGDRPTTLRDARKLNLCPSVSTVLSVIAKPALTQWQVRQGILAALTLPRIDGESEEDYLKRIDQDARKQAQEAALEGTRIHDAVEASFAYQAFPARYRPHVEAVRSRLSELFPKVTDWVAERSFAHPLGYGGKCDLHSPSTGLVVDFKSKDGDFSDGKKLAYEQHQQLAAYQVGLMLPRSMGANVFVSRTHPGCIATHIWEADKMENGWRVFEAALALHKAIKNYDGGWI